jgi:3',5'-nucleoside bisphosphate phosphatase
VPADLHTHSTASDGCLSPAALVERAHAAGLHVFALTDHDTLAGHTEALHAAGKFGVRVIPGVEISALFENREVHVLGYCVQPDAKTQVTFDNLRSVRVSRAKRILAHLTRMGVPVAFETVAALAGDAIIGRPQIARAMLQAGHVASFDEAFDRYLGEGKPAWAPNDTLTPAQAVALIHSAGGAASLAHPGLFRGELRGLLRHMLDAGLDAIETHHPAHTTDQTNGYAGLAFEHRLIQTGGSDFHGRAHTDEAPLGSISCPRGMLERLDARIAQIRRSTHP